MALFAVGLKDFDLLLPLKFFFQREGCGSRATGFLDLAVDVLDFAFETDFRIICPVIEFCSSHFKEPGISL